MGYTTEFRGQFDLNKKLGATLIIVTHDEDLAKLCRQRVVLKDGELVSSKVSGAKK